MKYLLLSFFSCFFIFSGAAYAQDSSAFKWTVTSKKLGDKVYELTFSTPGNNLWQLYGPNEVISEVRAVEIELGDSSITIERPFKESGESKTITSAIFENASFKVYEGALSFTATLNFAGKVPASLIGTLQYTFGKDQEFYPLIPFGFNVPMEGGVSGAAKIKIDNIDLAKPVINTGGTGTEGSKSLWGIFVLGILGGLVGLIMPCTFPMIPLTVAFFTKQSGDKKKGIGSAFIYGFSIFLIYVLISLPFHFLDQSSSGILNNISTNAWLNLAFALIFFVFALSFFGLFEITLPSSVTNKVGARSGVASLGGIFFMALTLAIVSFSCTGPILGSLLVGALNEDGGAIQLTVAMAGFGLALGLPFGIFAMFPNWLSQLPKSGSWMTTVKIVFAFIELALFIKFFSNADLVMHWGLLKREVFFGIWILLGLATSLYLFGILRFHGEPRPKLGSTRLIFALAFLAFTIYLVPGVTNTRYANRALVSGFPPPFNYSIYGHASASGKGVEANVTNDYEKALQLARQEGKPLLIDFTGWACVNCRKMEENVWTAPEIKDLIEKNFILVSLYVDDRQKLPKTDQFIHTAADGSQKTIQTIGDKYSTMQSENFKNASQPLYVILNGEERLMNLPVGYTPDEQEYARWLSSGLDAFKKISGQASK
jgi:cytochrome c biogenesis protein CcdA/thioredoxin-related protein